MLFRSVSLIDGAAFQDPVLKDLLQRLQSGNLSMVQAEARLRQAQATLSGAGAARLPQVGVNVQGGRSGSKGSTTGRSSSGGNAGALSALGLDQDTLSQLGGNGKGATNNVQAGTTISWAPDLWGKVSAQVESGRAALQAAEANRRAAELQAQVSLIQAYWRMRLEKLNAFSELEIIVEPGRAITANAGILVTKVEYLKSNESRNFAIVDAGMNDMIRPALYQAYMNILEIDRTLAREEKIYDVVGPICETSDFLGKQRKLAIAQGDYLAQRSAGAYGASMSSNYNSRPRTAEIGRAHV